MSRVTLSPKAKSDLSEIWDYSLAQWGVNQAEKYIRELWAEIEKQASDPTTSIDIGDVMRGYRKTRSGSHVIFFKQTKDGIDVVRILYKKMDFDRHL